MNEEEYLETVKQQMKKLNDKLEQMKSAVVDIVLETCTKEPKTKQINMAIGYVIGYIKSAITSCWREVFQTELPDIQLDDMIKLSGR